MRRTTLVYVGNGNHIRWSSGNNYRRRKARSCPRLNCLIGSPRGRTVPVRRQGQGTNDLKVPEGSKCNRIRKRSEEVLSLQLRWLGKVGSVTPHPSPTEQSVTWPLTAARNKSTRKVKVSAMMSRIWFNSGPL